MQIIDELWESVVDELDDPDRPGSLPVSTETRALLDEQMRAYVADPTIGRPWAEVYEALVMPGNRGARRCGQPLHRVARRAERVPAAVRGGGGQRARDGRVQHALLQRRLMIGRIDRLLT